MCIRDRVYAELIAELEAVIDSKVLPLKYYKTIKEGKEVDDDGQLGRVTPVSYTHLPILWRVPFVFLEMCGASMRQTISCISKGTGAW